MKNSFEGDNNLGETLAEDDSCSVGVENDKGMGEYENICKKIEEDPNLTEEAKADKLERLAKMKDEMEKLTVASKDNGIDPDLISYLMRFGFGFAVSFLLTRDVATSSFFGFLAAASGKMGDLMRRDSKESKK